MQWSLSRDTNGSAEILNYRLVNARLAIPVHSQRMSPLSERGAFAQIAVLN